MIESAALLISERGVDATSFSDVVAHSGAPRGSIYHHFPGGKVELIEEATRFAGDLMAAWQRAALEGDDPLRGIDAVFDFWRSLLMRTNYSAGCPVVAATVAAETVPGARDTAHEAFASWLGPYSKVLERNGLSRKRAGSLATLVTSAFEGSIVLARAERSLRPLERVRDELRAAVGEAIAAVRR